MMHKSILMKSTIVIISMFLLFSFNNQDIMPDGSDARKTIPEQAEIEVPVVFDPEGKTEYIDISDGQRLLSDDPLEIMERIERLNESDGFNIVFLGDSVVYGDGTLDERRTIPALLKKKLSMVKKDQEINVFNFALPSAGPADVYLIARELVNSKIDLCIYDLNMGWLDRQETLEHPVLLNLGANKELDAAAYHVYNIDLVKFSTYNIYELDYNLEDLATPWNEKNWDGVFYTEDGSQFGRIRPEWSEQWVYTQKIVALLREKNIKALFFAIPRNFKLLEEYNFIDYPAYISVHKDIFSYLESEGVKVINLDHAVPYDYFADVVHLLPDGEEIVANKLLNYVINIMPEENIK
jgi:hypothetical protein